MNISTMTKFPSHYESLNVTRDAPFEVIRAAYRSLSQKHHPDKNIGNDEAAQMMARLNAAYSVLSDAEQRELYDLQLLYQQSGGEAVEPSRSGFKVRAGFLLFRIVAKIKRWNGRLLITLLGGLALAAILFFWLVWKDHRSTLQIEQAMIYSAAPASPAPQDAPAASKETGEVPGAGKASRVAVIQMSGPSGLADGSAEQPAPAAAPKAPAAPAPAAKESEYARLTAMLKSMGFGLHKLDTPAQASNAKPAPEKAAAPAKVAEPAKASAAPAAAMQASSAVAASENSRTREEPARPAAPEPARNEAKPVAEASRVASAAPAASTSAASSSRAQRNAVVAEAGSCTPPPYPINAYRNGETGTVLLALLVGTDGRVIESKVQKSSGWSDLDKAARKALSLCKFKPAEGQTEPAWANLAYVWSID